MSTKQNLGLIFLAVLAVVAYCAFALVTTTLAPPGVSEFHQPAASTP